MCRILLSVALCAAAVVSAFAQFECSHSVIDIRRDICPQRTGPDPDCDKLCKRQAKANQGTLLGARCNLRQGGVLFSQFGITSFVCQCCIGKGLQRTEVASESEYKEVRKTQAPHAKRRIAASNTLAILTRDEGSPVLRPYFGSASCSIERPVRSPEQLTCSTFDDVKKCSWLTPDKSTKVEWYQAEGAPNPEVLRSQFGSVLGPDGSYLMVFAPNTIRPHAKVELHSCPIMCTDGPVTITVRHWRSDDVEIDICFKEHDEKPNQIELCAPLLAKENNMATEILPEARNFSVYLKIRGLKGGDMVLIDDLKMEFVPCKEAIFSKKPNVVAAGLPLASQPAISVPECIGSADCESFCDREMAGKNFTVLCVKTENKEHKRCQCVEKLTIPQRQFDRTCIGVNSASRCEQKCVAKHGDKLLRSQCRRQPEAPFLKQCVCSLARRQLPQKNIDAIASREVDSNSTAQEPCTGSIGLRLCALRCRRANVSRTARPTCTRSASGDQFECQCGAEEEKIEAEQSANIDDQSRNGSIAAHPGETDSNSSACDLLRCDFEQFHLCGWRDLSVSHGDFRRLIVAQRRPGTSSDDGILDAVDGRRYVVSRMPANGMVGMVAEDLRLPEPQVLRFQIFRTDQHVDVKICLNTIGNCVSKEKSDIEWPLRTWQQTFVSLPQNTTKVFIIGENKGNDWSALGIDKIDLMKWSDEPSKTPTILAC